MKISSPHPQIGSLTEAISNGVKEILQLNCDQDLYHWLTNNLLPSLAWLATDHLSSCVEMSEGMCNAILLHLSALSGHIQDTLKFLQPAQDPKAPALDEEDMPRGPEFISHKTRQMNILVYIITRQVLQLMADSMEFLKEQAVRTKAEPEPSVDESDLNPREVDMDISSSLVWLNDKDYQLCVTFTSKTESPIDNCVCTITNIDGTAGTTSVRVTHYSMLEQAGLIHRIYFGTISPRQHRKILIEGKNVTNTTFTVTIQDSVMRWKENQKLQPRLISAIASRINVRDEDVSVIQILKSTEEDNECVVVLLRLFSPQARNQLRTLRKHQRCMDFQLLNVVDIREGMPPECMQLYGLPEMVVNVSSSVVQEAHYTESNCSSEAGYEEDVDNPSRRISFSAMNKCEKNWVADIFLCDTLPVIDALVVQEELFRQEVYQLLATNVLEAPREDVDMNAVKSEVYNLLESKYISITNSNFVKELLFQFSLYGQQYDEVAFIAHSIAKQAHAGGCQELYSTALKPASYQQMVNLFMNVYILRHHLNLTLPEHTTQLQEELVAVVDTEDAERQHITVLEQRGREGLKERPATPQAEADLPAAQPLSAAAAAAADGAPGGLSEEEKGSPAGDVEAAEGRMGGDVAEEARKEEDLKPKDAQEEVAPAKPSEPVPVIPEQQEITATTKVNESNAVVTTLSTAPPAVANVPEASTQQQKAVDQITVSLDALSSAEGGTKDPAKQPSPAVQTPTIEPSKPPAANGKAPQIAPLVASPWILPPQRPEPVPQDRPVAPATPPVVPSAPPPPPPTPPALPKPEPVVPAEPPAAALPPPEKEEAPAAPPTPPVAEAPSTAAVAQIPEAPKAPEHPWWVEIGRTDPIPYRREGAIKALAALPQSMASPPKPAVPASPPVPPARASVPASPTVEVAAPSKATLLPSTPPQQGSNHLTLPAVTTPSQVPLLPSQSAYTPPSTPPGQISGGLQLPQATPPAALVTPPTVPALPLATPPSANDVPTAGQRRRAASPVSQPSDGTPRGTSPRDSPPGLPPQRPVALQTKSVNSYLASSSRQNIVSPPSKTRVALQVVQPTASPAVTTTVRLSPRPGAPALGRPVAKAHTSAITRASLGSSTGRPAVQAPTGRVSPPKVFATQRIVTPRGVRAASTTLAGSKLVPNGQPGGSGPTAVVAAGSSVRSRTAPPVVTVEDRAPATKPVIVTPRRSMPETRSGENGYLRASSGFNDGRFISPEKPPLPPQRSPEGEQPKRSTAPDRPPVVPSLALHFLTLSQADLQPQRPAPPHPSSAPCTSRPGQRLSGRSSLPTGTLSPRGAAAVDMSRAEVMRLRHEMTRERVRLREQELKKKAEAQIAAKFCAPKNVPLPEYLKREKKRRDDLLEQKNRCNELHALLKGGAFTWLPAQPPQPPPPAFRDGLVPSRATILDIDD